MGILDWLGLAGAARTSPASGSEAVQRIAGALAHMDPARARYLATFAYLLGRVANADHVVTDDERQAMAVIVASEGGLDPDQARLVAGIAGDDSLRRRGTDDFQVAQEFAELATEEQKLALLRCLFAVSASDEAVVTSEDNEVRRIAVQLKVAHDAFVAARAAVRDKLAVLRPGAGIRPATEGGGER
jgi:uncharacterized tellurite resistance protein B-like protein